MKKIFLIGLLLSIYASNVYAQCVSGCNINTGIRASNTSISTIEYDNIVSGYHGTIVKEDDGVVKVWGEYAQPNGTGHQTTPTIISPANGYNYTGTILKFAIGSSGNDQYAILTTTGLYVWGNTGRLVNTTIKSGAAFGAITVGGNPNGLPTGVSPTDVKMLFGSNLTLGIVTCSGDAWVLSGSNSKAGDGTTTNDNLWHRVKTNATTNLTGVVAMRGNDEAMMALTSAGALYTWGTGTFLGNGTASANRTYATQMSVPLDGATAITPKMIGLTINGGNIFYYVLGTNGKLYSTGDNTAVYLGRSITSPQPSNTNWGSVKLNLTGAEITNLAWFSVQEADDNYAAVNAISSDGKLYNWGDNSFDMLGGTSSTYNPRLINGASLGIATTDVIYIAETGGHTTMILKECEEKFGYAGHAENGSMANGTTSESTNSTFTFSTAEITLCGVAATPILASLLKICPENTANLANAYTGSASLAPDIRWYNGVPGASGTSLISNPASVGPGTYYAAFGTCTSAYNSVVVAYYQAGDAGANTCLDTDGDGVPNLADWDDDNDGIFDAVESPNCFYTSAEAHAIIKVTSPYNAASGDLFTTLHDLNTANANPFNFAGSQTITSGSAVFNFEFPTSVLMTSLAVNQSTNGMLSASSRYGVLYASNDGVTYTAISATTGVQLHTSPVTFAITSTTPYRYYQIRYIGTVSGGNATSGTLGTAAIQEIVPTYNTTNYQPSANQKPGACISDVDSDGIPNHLDTDSDGDGCADVIEGGANFAIGASYISAGRLTTTANANGVPGVPPSTTGYTQTAGQTLDIAQNNQISDCLDIDGDGVPNRLDLDNDNDGILDTDEGVCASQTVYELNIPSTLAAASASFNANGGSFNLVYTLLSGTAVAGLGTTFNVPFTYSDFTNLVSSVDHTWEGVNSAFTTTVDIRPVISTLYTSLPANNLNTEDANPVSPTSADAGVKYLINNGLLDKIGYFTTRVGLLPSPSGALSTFSSHTGFSQRSLWNTTIPSAGIHANGYYGSPQLVTTVAPTGPNSANYPSRYGETVIWDYTAFNDGSGSVATNSGTRGLIEIIRNTITYCNHRDTDGDGTPDYLDLDSDGDGCPDAIEGDENVLPANIDVNGRITGAVNASGVPNLVNSGGTADVGADQGQGIGQAAINNPVVAGTAAANQSIPAGTAPATLTLTGSSGTIQWQVSSDNITFANVATGGTSATYSPGVITSTRYYRAVITSPGGCTATSNAVTVEVCTQLPATGTPTSYTQTGVSNLEGFGTTGAGWPQNVPNGFIAIESKNKGFVITRVANTAAILSPVIGMLIYDNSADCVKLFTGTWKCLEKFCGF